MATNAMSLLPGRNPAGTMVAGDYSITPALGSTSGTNPIIPPTNLPSGAPQTNAYAPGSVVPTSASTTTGVGGGQVPVFGANSGGYTSTSLTGGSGTGANAGSSGTGLANLTPSQTSAMQRELSKTYGSGLASAIMQFLQGGAGFNQNAVNNIFAALQPGINTGEENLMEQFSASGNRFGSGAQIGLADYLSQVNLNEGQIESQLYEQSIQDYMSTLLGTSGQTAQRIASTPSTLDTVLGALGLGGSAVQGVSSLTSAISPNADTSILDSIGSLLGGF